MWEPEAAQLPPDDRPSQHHCGEYAMDAKEPEKTEQTQSGMKVAIGIAIFVIGTFLLLWILKLLVD